MPISEPRPSWLEDFVTRIPAAVAMISAGICETRPSPTVRIEYTFKARTRGMPFISPITIPPTKLMPVMTIPATASPRTNLLAPSIAP